ncbi:PDZ domain-containing protein [Microlunatus elymi]|uniref:endopeptidase La n=1 Tax=Microlunatus elymi TaxID=2596828 RepID=A0A516PZ62_9ACTN|nr:PDZ domain-containing protein [Microlunatus elymi]QDP96469.1 PDZ domain-containing protein [Microlunatus elymi]
MTRQTWTAFVAALAFVLAAVCLVVMPVPFVTWTPGSTTDTLGKVNGQPVISISGTSTYPTSGVLELTTVSETRADSRLSLPEALLAYFLPDRDTLPRDIIYPPGKTAAQVNSEQRVMMETSQDNAVVAALRSAGQRVVQRPAVASVRVGSPAYNKLQPGDLILTINGTDVTSNDQAEDLIRSSKPGGTLLFDVLRDRKHKLVKVSQGTDSEGGDDLAGITIGDGYEYAPDISFDLGEEIGGPSAGLVFALAIYDKITPGALLDGHRVAGTGTITADGVVGPIGGIQQKIAAASSSGATIFLVPASNCADLAGLHTDLNLIKVASLEDAITAMDDVADGHTTALPRCSR